MTDQDERDHPHAHIHFFHGIITALLVSANIWLVIFILARTVFDGVGE